MSAATFPSTRSGAAMAFTMEGGGGTEWSTEDVARHGLGQTQVIILINLCVNMSEPAPPLFY